MDASVPLHHREFKSEPDSSIAGPPWSDTKPARLSPPSSPSSKRSRRSVQKRVVSIPIQEAEGSRAKGVGECAPPSDSWAWRKYGQKPIKGSPYPRGYYRCSSSKGCPARKQVEKSRVDPTVLMVTYTCEHNHPWPAPKGQSNSKLQQQSPPPPPPPPPVKESSSNSNSSNSDPDPDAIMGGTPEPVVSAAADPEESLSMFSDLIGEDFSWFSDVGSTSSTSPPSDTFLYGPIFGSPAEFAADDSYDKIKDDGDGEDALFAGLEELPEYSVVFRRRYWDPQTAAASW